MKTTFFTGQLQKYMIICLVRKIKVGIYRLIHAKGELMEKNETVVEIKEQSNIVQPTTTVTQDILYLLLKIAVIAIVVVLLFTFMFGMLRVNDIAMSPAIQDGDVVFFYRLDKEYVASNPVVVSYEGEEQVRRVVAVAGDTVDITEDGLLINGSLVQEQEIFEDTLRFEDGISFPITIEDGQIFVLGDGRTNSVDSRLYGAVDIKDTLGKVMTIIRRRNI